MYLFLASKSLRIVCFYSFVFQLVKNTDFSTPKALYSGHIATMCLVLIGSYERCV